jgi:hypothetical protein
MNYYTKQFKNLQYINAGDWRIREWRTREVDACTRGAMDVKLILISWNPSHRLHLPSGRWRVIGSADHCAAQQPTARHKHATCRREKPVNRSVLSLLHALCRRDVTRETMPGRARGGRTCSPILIRTTPP